MLKKSFFSLCFVLVIANAFAQSRYTIAQLNKKEVGGVVNDITFSEKTTRDAIEEMLGKMGYRSSSYKGYTVYKGTKIKDLSDSATLDLYIMVERKSRQEKESSVITLLLSKGYENFITEQSDAAIINNAKNYLVKLRETVASYDLEMQITAQEDAIKKADKKMNNYMDDSTSIQRKIKKMEDEFVLNRADRANQKAETEKQRQILEMLKARRKANQ